MENKTNPMKEWIWNRKQTEFTRSYDGAILYPTHILWFTQIWPDWLGSGASEQTIAEYLKNGPYIKDVPEEILDELWGEVQKLP